MPESISVFEMGPLDKVIMHNEVGTFCNYPQILSYNFASLFSYFAQISAHAAFDFTFIGAVQHHITLWKFRFRKNDFLNHDRPKTNCQLVNNLFRSCINLRQPSVFSKYKNHLNFKIHQQSSCGFWKMSAIAFEKCFFEGNLQSNFKSYLFIGLSNNKIFILIQNN